MEIAPGIHILPAAAAGFMGFYAPNVYLVAGAQAALVDSGYHDADMTRTRLDYIESAAPLNLAYILLTHPHPDHAGGCSDIKNATGARIAAYSLSRAQSEAYRVKADVIARDKDILELGGVSIEVVHTPGHTRESLCFYVREAGVLFSGDHIVGYGTPVIARDGDMAEYIDSLKKLLDYKISLICPGHGPLIREPERKIRELIAHRQEREQQIISCLRRGKRCVLEMVSEIYPEVDSRLLALAGEQVLAHLSKLVKEGRASFSGEYYILKET
ncbi:MAG: MBL fold metallo-hydrolase [Dehalococcoidia bacterium]|nr:MBL fold metallo-hydrolase [Dehalococcoidia bacterium]